DTIKFDSAYYQFSGSSFGQYVMFGGLTTTGGNATITFSAGRYVFGGTTNNNPEFNIDNGTTIKDNPGGLTNYAGELMLFTNSHYTWNDVYADGTTNTGTLSLPTAIQSYNAAHTGAGFEYGQAGFKSGNNPNSTITLNGLNPAYAPSDLQDFAPFLWWQDRGNSNVQYDNHGNIIYPPSPCTFGLVDTSQLGGLDNPCKQLTQSPTAPQMNL